MSSPPAFEIEIAAIKNELAAVRQLLEEYQGKVFLGCDNNLSMPGLQRKQHE